MWTCRGSHLRQALGTYQEAASMTTETTSDAAYAETAAEASLKLAFFCNELLQVTFNGLLNSQKMLYFRVLRHCRSIAEIGILLQRATAGNGNQAWLFTRAWINCVQQHLSQLSQTRVIFDYLHMQVKQEFKQQRNQNKASKEVAFGMQNTEDQSSIEAAEVQKADANAFVKEQYIDLAAMLVHHMLKAMHMGGPSGNLSIST